MHASAPITSQPPPAAADAATLDVLDPATGERIGTIPAGDPAQAGAAVRAARAAQPHWARTPPAERAEALKAAARRLREHVDELAALQARETGKSEADSRGGVEAGIVPMRSPVAGSRTSRVAASPGAGGGCEVIGALAGMRGPYPVARRGTRGANWALRRAARRGRQTLRRPARPRARRRRRPACTASCTRCWRVATSVCQEALLGYRTAASGTRGLPIDPRPLPG